jgi:hypothetical protein
MLEGICLKDAVQHAGLPVQLLPANVQYTIIGAS